MICWLHLSSSSSFFGKKFFHFIETCLMTTMRKSSSPKLFFLLSIRRKMKWDFFVLFMFLKHYHSHLLYRYLPLQTSISRNIHVRNSDENDIIGVLFFDVYWNLLYKKVHKKALVSSSSIIQQFFNQFWSQEFSSKKNHRIVLAIIARSMNL